jgi:hypothetical protein
MAAGIQERAPRSETSFITDISNFALTRESSLSSGYSRSDPRHRTASATKARQAGTCDRPSASGRLVTRHEGGKQKLITMVTGNLGNNFPAA